ncbi:universal stress protein [Mycobacterium sherrisii]|uniref:universal stress protein n=1 Tax=Mycobacterium sherrisii TaxID=243061 RepID=UPI000A157A8A|nr:universal stress protein [Mycobacterium sherrisii]MCV7027729.1 universal stress protein [Mycobacterium sherrisii]ORW77494.1 universal stress protein UspA [Mycobacterium sherrisii]
MTALQKRYGIVVGVDGSPASSAAVVWAARDAAVKNVSLHLVHMFNTFVPTFPQVPMPSGVARWQSDAGQQALEQAAKLAREALPAGQELEITTELRPEPPAPTLIEISEDAQMIVVGSNGNDVMSRILLGSVSSAVVRGAKCPVGVIHAETSSRPSDRAPVLVGIDGSPASELATAVAFEEAARRDVQLVALHAWSDFEFFEIPGYEWSAVRAEAERSLSECLAGWHDSYPDVPVRQLVVADRPARQLIKQSESAQLVVVGSHGRGCLTGAMLGSVSNAVVHSIRTPVIVARPA